MDNNQWTFFPNDMFQFSAGQQMMGGNGGNTETPSMSLKRRAARILKTNSAGTSPRAIGRRKTTAVHGAGRQRFTLDSARHVSEDNGYTVGRSRPISWHPSSYAASKNQSPVAIPPQHANVTLQMPLEANFTTASVNGAVTPLAYPYPDEPLPTELFSTLDGYQEWAGQNVYQGFPRTTGFAHTANSVWPQQALIPTPIDVGHQLSPTQPVNEVQYATEPTYTFGLQTMPHFNMAQSMATTAPPTPDFLPIQNFSADAEPQSTGKEESEKDELIGMGLYDAPDVSPFQEASLEEYLYLTRLDGAQGGPVRPMGKGLKLEETFNPTTIDDDEDDDEEGEGEDEDAEYMSDGSAQEVQKVETVLPNKLDVSGAPPNLSNHTFFFENDELFPNRDNSMPILQTGGQWGIIGGAPYGWL
jgi:hypothetical protein